MILRNTIALYLNTWVSKVQEIPVLVYQTREKENDITSKIHRLGGKESTPFSSLFKVIWYALSCGLGGLHFYLLVTKVSSSLTLVQGPRDLGADLGRWHDQEVAVAHTSFVGQLCQVCLWRRSGARRRGNQGNFPCSKGSEGWLACLGEVIAQKHAGSL